MWKKFVVINISIFCLLSGSAFAGGVNERAVTDRYLAAYRTYQEAVQKSIPKAQLEGCLNEYLEAKAAYDKTFPGKSPAGTSQNTARSQITPDSALVPVDPDETIIANDPSLASAPPDLKQLIKNLWEKRNSPKEEDQAIVQMKSYIAKNPGSGFSGYAKYELAKALEWYKGDTKQSEALLSQVASDQQSSGLASIARQRIAYLKNKITQSSWKQKLEDKFKKMQEKYKTYAKTSWLAFPVKIARFFNYFGEFTSFKKTQDDETSFQLKFEELASTFVPSVEVAFDQTKVTQDGNETDCRIRLLTQNSESWFARWKLMNEARHSIDIQYFIVDRDAFGMAFLGLIHRKAKEGVKIRLMVDARGTNKFSHIFMGKDYLEDLAEMPNVEIKIFNQFRQNVVTFLTDVRRLIVSNHDKILIVDGKHTIIGGRNIANEYLVDKGDDPNSWRDCDVVMESEGIARQLGLAFDEEFANGQSTRITKDTFNWKKREKEFEVSWNAMNSFLSLGKLYQASNLDSTTRKTLKKINDELANYKQMMQSYPSFETMEPSHVCPVKIIDKHSLAGYRTDLVDQIIRFIDGARKEVIIQNPYIVLTPRSRAALVRAGKRGVSVLIQTNSPQTSDSFPTEGIMMADWRDILKDIPTCRIYAQMGLGQLHAKTFVIDKKVSIVGTYNMDFVSEQINSEVVASILSDDFSNELRTAIMGDIAKSKEYHLATADSAEYGPSDVDGKRMWLIKLCSKLGWMKPLF